MTTTTITLDAAYFLHSMRRRSFAFIGVAMLIRAHLTFVPGGRLSRAAVQDLFGVSAPHTRSLIDDVMDFSFREDDHGMIYSPSLERTVAPQ